MGQMEMKCIFDIGKIFVCVSQMKDVVHGSFLLLLEGGGGSQFF